MRDFFIALAYALILILFLGTGDRLGLSTPEDREQNARITALEQAAK